MTPKEILVILVSAFGIIMLNGRYEIMPTSILYYLSAGIMGIIIGGKILQKINNKQDTKGNLPNPIPPTEAKKYVQQHLRETRGKREVYISEHYEEGESFHEEMDEAWVNGEKKYYYGIVGKPKHPDRNEAESGFVRQVFNLTDTVPLKYNNEIVGSMDSQIKTSPLSDLDKIIRNEGRMTTEEPSQETKAGTVVQVQNQDQPKNEFSPPENPEPRNSAGEDTK